jgi:hypothetical protein
VSVWPVKLAPEPSLSGREGALVSVSIGVDPRHLESLLEALAQMSFPINPQIYHDAEVVYRYPDEREKSEVVTLVEFPAYSTHLEEVGRVLEAHGFDRSDIEVTSMLDEIHADLADEPAPEGAGYLSRRRVKTRAGGVQ